MSAQLLRACRSLRRSRGYAALVVCSVALSGAGCLVCLLAYLSPAAWRPGAVRDVDRVVEIRRALTGGGVPFISRSEVERYRRQSDVFGSVSAFIGRPVTARLSERRAERVMAEFVDEHYFTTLGVRPQVGRALSEVGPGGPFEVVIAAALFGGRADRSALGQTLWVNGHALLVVGIAPDGFEGASFASPSPKIWLPLALRDVVAGQLPGERRQDRADPNARWLLGVARLASGATLSAAQARLRALSDPLLSREAPFVHQGLPVSANVFGPVKALGTSAVVLLTCVFLVSLLNVSLLAYARGVTRRPEAEMLVALGASRGNVFTHWIGEGVVLALLGALAAILVATIVAAALPSLLSIVAALGLMRPSTSWGAPTAATFLFLSAACALALVVPFWVGVRPRCSNSAPLRGTYGRFGRAVAVALLLQVAVATLFGTVALALERMCSTAGETEPRLRTAGVSMGSLALSEASKPREAFRRLADELASSDLTGRYALSTFPPMSTTIYRRSVNPADRAESSVPVHIGWNTVDGNYFDLFDIPVLAGRGLTNQDDSSQPPVVVLNQAAAEVLWPGRNPVGLAVAVRGERVPRTVVGVSANVADGSIDGMLRGASPHAYVPIRQVGDSVPSSLTVSAQSFDLMGPQLDKLSQRLGRIEPSLALDDIRSAEVQRRRPFRHVWALAAVAAAFGGIVLIVGGVGVFGTTTCVLASRSHEAAVRVALGAQPMRLASSFLLNDALCLAAGVVLGATGGVVVSKSLSVWILGKTMSSVGSAIVAASLSSAIWAVAALWPVLRAITTNPAAALRTE